MQRRRPKPRDAGPRPGDGPKADYSLLALPKPGRRKRSHSERYTANQALAQPKAMRHKDPAALARARSRRNCDVCGRPVERAAACHVKSRGSGGADADANLYSGCVHCHGQEHAGRIDKEQLRAVIDRR